MKHLLYILAISIAFFGCSNSSEKSRLNQNTLQSLGTKYKNEFNELADFYKHEIETDSSNVDAYVGYIDAKVLLYVFGYTPRKDCMQPAWRAYEVVNSLESTNSDVRKVAGILNFLDWQWQDAATELKRAIELDSTNLSARHWYSLWLMAMMQVDEAMAQSDIIMSLDDNNEFRVGRASMHYFLQEYGAMKVLMQAEIEANPTLPWPYDWLGMAYNGLGEHEKALDTYFKAFELSDGTVEVGAGLGHALGEAGEFAEASKMAAYYSIAAKNNYLPYCQRSFIHISLEEYDKALDLIEEAYEAKSWFLIFIQIEHWYDPIRQNPRFQTILQQMNYPEI